MASSMLNLVFDYLNNNQHKFDQHGNFDSTPDERDYIPFGAVTYANGGWGGRPRSNNTQIKKPQYAGKYKEGQGPDDLAKEHMEYHANDYKNGIRYDEQKCWDIKEFEEGLCYDGYQGRALQACLERVGDRHHCCKRDHHFNNAPKMWTAEDMTGQPVGDEDLDKRPKKSGSNAQPSPEPEKEQDKSEFSLAKLRDSLANPLNPLFVMNPAALYALDPLGTKARLDRMWARLNQAASPLVMRRENYPEASKYIPTEGALAAASMVPLPSGGIFAVRPPAPRGW